MIRTELTLRLPNSPGALGGVCRLLGNERVNLLALAVESSGLLHLVVDNPLHAAAVLREQHHQVTEHDVLVVRVANTPGAGAAALQLFEDAGVNIDYAYGAAPEGGAGAALVVGVADAMRAATLTGI